MSVTTQAVSSSTGKATNNVLSRELVWGAREIVRVDVPKWAVPRSYVSNDEVKSYLDFYYHVKGGAINFFLHASNPSRFLGAEICAEVEVWERTLVGGKRNLQVNLHPCDKDPTHRISVVPVARDIILQEGQKMIETPCPPLQGGVVIGPVGSKIMTKQAIAAIKLREDLEFAKGDSQLTRLIQHGWKISRHNDVEVFLEKILPDGVKKSGLHKRPRVKNRLTLEGR